MCRWPEPNAGKRLDLEVDHRRALRLREAPHLLLTERDVLEHLGGDSVEGRRDVVGAESEALRLPAVEAGGVPPHGVVAVCCDVGHDLVDDLRNGIAVVCALVRARWLS